MMGSINIKFDLLKSDFNQTIFSLSLDTECMCKPLHLLLNRHICKYSKVETRELIVHGVLVVFK
jgi:hypothetical protein